MAQSKQKETVPGDAILEKAEGSVAGHFWRSAYPHPCQSFILCLVDDPPVEVLLGELYFVVRGDVLQLLWVFADPHDHFCGLGMRAKIDELVESDGVDVL